MDIRTDRHKCFKLFVHFQFIFIGMLRTRHSKTKSTCSIFYTFVGFPIFFLFCWIQYWQARFRRFLKLIKWYFFSQTRSFLFYEGKGFKGIPCPTYHEKNQHGCISILENGESTMPPGLKPRQKKGINYAYVIGKGNSSRYETIFKTILSIQNSFFFKSNGSDRSIIM